MHFSLGVQTQRLLNLQKKSVRTITKSHFLAHTDSLFKELKILKVDDIFRQHQFTFYYKFKNNMLPNCLSNIISNQEANVRQCHTSFFLKPPNRVNMECTKLCIRHSIPQLVNTYDRVFVNSISNISLPSLKRNFKLLTLTNYNFVCTDQNCYSCISRFFDPSGFSGSLRYLHIFNYMINFIYQRNPISTGFLIYLNIFNHINI